MPLLTNWLQRTIIIFQAITIRTAARQLREAQAQVLELEKALANVPPCKVMEFFNIDGGPYRQSFTTACSLHVGHFGYHEARGNSGEPLLLWPNGDQPMTKRQHDAMYAPTTLVSSS